MSFQNDFLAGGERFMGVHKEKEMLIVNKIARHEE